MRDFIRSSDFYTELERYEQKIMEKRRKFNFVVEIIGDDEPVGGEKKKGRPQQRIQNREDKIVFEGQKKERKGGRNRISSSESSAS